jgi:hypothetical protein
VLQANHVRRPLRTGTITRQEYSYPRTWRVAQLLQLLVIQESIQFNFGHDWCHKIYLRHLTGAEGVSPQPVRDNTLLSGPAAL